LTVHRPENSIITSQKSVLAREKSQLSIRVRALGRWGRVKGLWQGGGGHIMTYADEKRGGGVAKAVF